MLGTALDAATQTEIVAVHRFRLLVAFLLCQQRCQCMSRRMHPSPRLSVAEVVVASYALAQMVEGFLDTTFMILELTVEHFFGDTKDVLSIVAQEAATGGQALHR